MYGDQARLVIKHYPYKYRDFARISAQAALSAGEQGRFWEMHDLLLNRSPKLSRESLIGYAKELGLDIDRFLLDLDAPKQAERIDRDLALAMKLDLYNTPTYYINGRKVVGNRPLETLRAIVDEELKNAKK